MILLEPIKIRGLTLKNRVVMAPMTTRLAAASGEVTEELIAYYVARAKGGAGLITIELCSPHPSGCHRRREIGIYSDQFIEGLTRLTAAIKAHGAKISVQIGHAGSHARPDVTGFPAVAPSEVPHPVQEGDHQIVTPRALTTKEIEEIVSWYAESAQRMKTAGFDAIDIQGGHDYLIAQFLSPLDNLRTDQYGGTFEGRSLFALEVIRACRRTIGEMPIIFRFSGDEFAAGGFTLADACQLAPLLVAAGVDAIHVSAGSHRTYPFSMITCPPMASPQAPFVPLAKAIKYLVSIPVIAVGKLHDPQLAESVLAEGCADMICLGRGLIADPEWVVKLQSGRADEIRKCIACNTCVLHLRGGESVACLVNPAAAHEQEFVFRRVQKRQRILVVGGGPAGMTAATILAQRGHSVVLCERATRLGGALWRTMRAPYFQEVESSEWVFKDYIAYLEHMAKKANVEIRVGVAVTPKLAKELKPDTIVVAEGMAYVWPLRFFVGPILNSSLSKTKVFRWIARKKRIKTALFRGLRRPRKTTGNALTAAGFKVLRIGECADAVGTEEALRSAARLAYDLGA